MISPKLLPVVFLLLTALLVPFASGCASRDGKTYSDGDVRKVQRVSVGTVVDVTEVMVEDDPSLVGPIIGGVAGGVVGSLFGAGAGKTLATLGGAAIGAVAGGAGEAALKRYPANQITIELDDGGFIVVVQGYEDFFVKGDRVRIITMGKNPDDATSARVQHY
jgi:outer membrane lipoprotein SlyB